MWAAVMQAIIAWVRKWLHPPPPLSVSTIDSGQSSCQTEDYLQLSRDVVKALAETEKTQVVQLNKGQCKFLKEKVLQTMRRIGEDLDSLPCTELAIFTQRCKAALQQLYRTVKDAEAIIHSCCMPNAAIKLTNINEACAQVLFKLDWCTAICLDCRLSVTASKFEQYVTKNIEGFGAVECEIKMEEIRKILLRYHALDNSDSSETTFEPELSNNTQAVAQDSVASLSKLEMCEQKTKRLDLLSIDPQELTWIKRIGSGSDGTVHEVRWKNEHRARKDFHCNPSLEHEAEILAGLSHPNIVQIFGHCIAEKSSLVMELMHGNLTDHIDHRGKSLELPVALDIMLQVAEGMQYLHEKRVAHRDLKSGNILVNPLQISGMENSGYLQVKVADFGLSAIKEASATYSMQSPNTGTTRWMAPELFEESDPKKCRYPFKADVYSYAITCFEILTAKFPFEDTTSLTEVRRKVKAGERPVLPVTLPTFLSSLIERCWDPEANTRPSFSEICAELRHFQGVLMISNLGAKLGDASGYPCQTFVVPPHLPKYTLNGDVMVDRQLQNFEDPHRRMLDYLRHGMEPFASAGLSKPTGYNTKPTWFHIPWTHTPDFVTEGDTDEDTRNAGPPYFSSFEILVQLLINSDLPAQIAIFQLLLDQRCSVPLLVPHGKTYYTQFRTEQIIHRLSPGLSHLGDVLDFVTVKLANQKILSISEDRNLPRVVFVSDRKVLSSRETPDMASDVMNCQFISKYSKNDTGDGPVVEVGVGFLATPGDQPHKHMPCLVLCVWGDHDQLGEFLEKVADIVIVETEPTQEPRVLIWAGGHQDIDVLYWNINSTGRRSSNKNGKHMMCGSFKDLTGDIAIYLMAAISNKNFKASEGGTTSLKECLPRQIQPLNLKVATSNVTDLDATNLERIKDDFLLQKSFVREAKNFFESLRLKGDQAALKQRQNQIQQEKGYRASETDNVMRLPILGNFIELLKEKHDLKRKIGIRQFQLSINKKLQPMVEKAAKKVDDAFEAFQQQPEDLELKQTYYSAKGEHVDQMLGLEHLWRELSHMFAADPSSTGELPRLAAQHLVDGFPLEILDGDAAMFHKLWVETVLLELNKYLHVVLERDPKVLVLSVIGLQSSGKSTLLNLMFGTQLKTSAGQCTRGVYLQVVKSKWSEYDYVLLLDTEGIRAPEYFGLKGAELHDNRLATFTVLPVDACIVMVGNEEDSGLKEVLPMVMLAFKESAMAEDRGGQMQAKLFFVYRSVDTNDTKKLLKNQRKLQEDLRQASQEIANLWINEGLEVGGSQVRQPHSTLDSLQKFRIDPDEEKSDVKFFGNLKKSNVPPFDVPDWEYGIKVVKLREYINNRVLHGGWESHGLKAWTKYLCMVWDCIADANFELGFLNSIEYTHYHELQTRLARCRQIVGHKWLEELEILEGTLQGAIRSELEMSTIGLMKTLKSKVEDTIKEETREVDKILQQKQCHKWKVEETSHWGNFCSDQERQWMKRLEDCVDGVVKFDSVVKDYNNKIRVEIESDAKRYEDLTAKDRETKMKDHFENNIFKRILREAEEKYPSEEPTIPQRVLAQYRKHQVVGHRHTFNESEASSVVTKRTTLIHGQKLNISEEKHIYNELISKVESCLEDTKQYADHLVLEVIQFTEMLTEGKGKSVQQTFHNLAKDVLTLRLQAIQLEWDKHHNVAKRLEMEHARLWQFFQNCANRVGGTKVLSDEVVNLLNHNLLESFKVLLTKRVCDQLQGEAWVTNWRVMKAHLDLQLINLIEEENIDELLTCVANGTLHHETVVGIQIQEALNKTLDQNELWPWFMEEIKYAVNLAASAARIRNVQQKSILFHDMLKELLCKTSSELAKTISLVDVYSQVEDVIDFSTVGEKVSEEINHVQPDLTSSISELVQKVKTRLIMCESECARPRCEQMCPLCAVTCIHSSGHSGKHHTVHQPQGLIGYHNEYTKCLVPESCTQSVALSTRPTFKAPKFGIDSYVPYKDFEKHFPQWVLPTEFSSRGLIKLREYIFASYQKNLVEKYLMVKICSDIPSEYKNHNLKELRHELENFIALNS